MADDYFKYKPIKHKNTNSHNNKTYYSINNTKRKNSSLSNEKKLPKYKNEMLRKIENFISKENNPNQENEIKISSQANKDIKIFKEKRSSYLELFQNQSNFSKSKLKGNNGN